MALQTAELATRVAQKLGILSVGEVLNAEDAELINSKMESVRDQLDDMRIVSVDLESGLRDTYVNAFVDITSAQLVDDFELPEPRRSTIRAEGLLGLNPMSPAERWLRKLVSRASSGAPVRAEYF